MVRQILFIEKARTLFSFRLKVDNISRHITSFGLLLLYYNYNCYYIVLE